MTTLPKAPTGLWWLLVGLVVVVFLLGRILGPKKETATATQKPLIATPARAERVVETTAPVGRWSKNVSIPSLHWFRIIPGGKIRIKFWDGRVVDDEPGRAVWLGDNIPNANFRLRSREEKEVKVKIVLSPK